VRHEGNIARYRVIIDVLEAARAKILYRRVQSEWRSEDSRWRSVRERDRSNGSDLSCGTEMMSSREARQFGPMHGREDVENGPASLLAHAYEPAQPLSIASRIFQNFCPIAEAIQQSRRKPPQKVAGDIPRKPATVALAGAGSHRRRNRKELGAPLFGLLRRIGFALVLLHQADHREWQRKPIHDEMPYHPATDSEFAIPEDARSAEQGAHADRMTEKVRGRR